MQPIIAGHRGAAGRAPENTLPSFLKAVELGVRLIELDVRLTRDGELVCFHDDRVDRVTAARGLVSEWDWAALSELEVLPGAFQGAYPGARIPRLAEVLAALPADCRFLVELKAEPVRPELLVERAVAAIRAAGAGERCRIISFDFDLLRLCRDTSMALGVLAATRDAALLFPRARELGAQAVHPPHNLVNPQLVTETRDGGFLLNTWTVNTADEYRRLAALGVDEVTTDHPDQALSWAATSS
ncbi:MAG: glycerophosphodiester phosphodiesterase [Actinomycetota bacterium]